MTVRFGAILIDCEYRQRAAEFSCAASAYRIVGSDHTGIAIAGDSGTDDAAPRLDRTSCGTDGEAWCFCHIRSHTESPAGTGAGAMDADPTALAAQIDRRIVALPHRTTQSIRDVRRTYSTQLRGEDGAWVLAIADALVESHRWVAYELVYHHRGARAGLGIDQVTRLGRGLDGWASVDAFARYISGPAWQHRLIPDELVQGWTTSQDRWCRRAALVSTVPLNLRSASGSGDAARTLDICHRLVADRDDMVVKALSWALRELVTWDSAAVRGFLDEHHAALPSRVRREVVSKLETGRKDRRHGRPTP